MQLKICSSIIGAYFLGMVVTGVHNIAFTLLSSIVISFVALNLPNGIKS